MRFSYAEAMFAPSYLMGALCAVTTRLRLATFVLKLPIRGPVLVAKTIASLAVLSGERVSLGVGTSPWPEDFEATGEEWTTRGARTDEMIEIMRGLELAGRCGRSFGAPSGAT